MSSNTKVTITLGRSGQVVTKESFKRLPVENSWSYDSGFSSLSSNKRHRGDGAQWIKGYAGNNGSRIAPNDLRLKLMRKRQSKRAQDVVKQHRIIGKHQTLSRSSETPVSYRMLSTRPSSSRYSNFRPIRADEFHSGFSRADSSRRTNPSQIMGGPRTRSPDRLFRATRELSPPRTSGHIKRMPPIRNGDFSSSRSLLRSDGPSESKPLFTSSPLLKSERPIPQTGSPVPRVAQTKETLQQVWRKVDVPATVPSLLHSLGLGKYCINFQAEEVDMTVLKQMGEKDLKDMGIPMGPRKKILLALLPPPKKPTSS
ncbi:hypothetical protein LINPERPRIM_LOCUS32293 [Linum perenne]